MKNIKEIDNEIKALNINLRIFKHFISNQNLMKYDNFVIEFSYHENGILKSGKYNFSKEELLRFPNVIRKKIANLNLIKNNFINININ